MDLMLPSLSIKVVEFAEFSLSLWEIAFGFALAVVAESVWF